jgi:hypothetical protein
MKGGFVKNVAIFIKGKILQKNVQNVKKAYLKENMD